MRGETRVRESQRVKEPTLGGGPRGARFLIMGYSLAAMNWTSPEATYTCRKKAENRGAHLVHMYHFPTWFENGAWYQQLMRFYSNTCPSMGVHPVIASIMASIDHIWCYRGAENIFHPYIVAYPTQVFAFLSFSLSLSLSFFLSLSIFLSVCLSHFLSISL